MTSKTIYYNVPYFYIILHIKTGIKYAGCQYSKTCKPEDLLVKYFTSSKPVKNIIKAEGISSFKIEEIILESEIKIPFGWNNIYDYESWFLQTNNCKSSSLWFNQHNNEGGFSFQNVSKGKASYFIPGSSNHIYLPVEFAKSIGYVSIKSGKNHHFYDKTFKCPPGHSKGEKNGMYGKKQPSLSARNIDPILAAENGIKYSNFILRKQLAYFNIILDDVYKFKQTSNIVGSAQHAKNRKIISDFVSGLLVVQSKLSIDKFIRLLTLVERMLDRNILVLN